MIRFVVFSQQLQLQTLQLMVDLYVCGQVLCILPLMATATFVSQLCLSACVCFIFPFDILLWVSAISDKRLSCIHVLVRLFISQQTQILCLLTTAAVYETIAWNSNSAGQTFIKWELMCFYHIVVGLLQSTEAVMIGKDGSHSLRNICCDIEICISFNL